ncbi:sentrin-specific protease 1-like [Olea europaea subsp. europaea]|uniref:Sentrin-specific protease 1-like n=1 Tax=Olea europaea subsp. europaea TaxID=158383 RepID=A0A8S0T4Y2_OLEEU|nr:sentrin-specific protease 1-like [Olea europaea subsp. europaea]
MEKSKAAKLVINVEETFERRSKRKSVVSPQKTPPNKQPASLIAKKLRSKKIEICDLVPTEAEMAMPYMDGMQHNKTIQPEFSRGSRLKESRKGKSVDPSHMSEKSVPLVMDTGVRQAHITDDDDDFVDPPRRCEGISHQETPRADEGPSELKSQNKVLTVEMDAIKSQMSSLNSDQVKKISGIILMQGQLKHDMIEIRTNMQFLSESVTARISSSMDEILKRFNDRKGCPVNEYEDTEAAVEGFEKIDEVGGKLQPIVDRKGKGKVDPTEDVAFPSSLESPSFDLGIRYTQPDDLQSAEIQKQVDAVISDVITASQNVDEEGSPTIESASELPVKRTSRPARILWSPFVVREGKVPRHDSNVIVFGNYKDHVEEADKLAFLGWFQRGKKFNEHDDQIKPAFSIGLYPVGHKTWFYQLIDAETSLSGSNKIKDIFSAFQKDLQVLLSKSSLIKAVTGRLISLNTSWANVDYVFMPLLSKNKAHWMLGLVELKRHTLMLFNSTGKTYRDWKVLEGIESYVKVLPALMKALGISKKDPDYNESECKQMKVTIDSTLPQQTNECDIPHQFDTAKCRIDIASTLYKHRKPYVKKVRHAFKGEGIVIE